MARLTPARPSTADLDEEQARKDALAALFINHEKKIYKRFVQVTRENILDLAEYLNASDAIRDSIMVIMRKDGKPALAKPGYRGDDDPREIATVGQFIDIEGSQVADYERRNWTPSDERVVD